MSSLFTELRRREVFRTAGLYVGIAWIVIEGASVLLPAFDAPEWVLRALIIVAIIGLPVTLVLAWVFDITDKGIEVQADPTDTIVPPFGGRRMDFVVIGVLTVALVFSVYLNLSGNSGEAEQQIEPLSVLIADFDNKTGDELFDGTLEQALQIGVESAPFITGYRRDAAKRVASAMQWSDNTLDEPTARLVSVREGVKLVMAGGIEEDDGAYRIYVRAVDPKGGEVLASADVDAKDKLNVLNAVGTLAGDLREELGDKSLDRDRLAEKETFTAKSLEAAQAYAKAQSLQYNGKYEEAMEYYREALAQDPGFGRAYSGLALSANALGRTSEADELWEKALATLDTMTERERLRTLGIYYSVVTRNFEKAIETYRTLIEKYPADDTAHNGLAVQYFYTLDFQKALQEGAELLDIYPNSVMGRSNYALYAMYAGDFDKAVEQAAAVRELDESYFKAWLPVAMKALADGDVDAANGAYGQMARTGSRGMLTALIGHADAELFAGDLVAAREALADAIEKAEAAGSQYFLATSQMALAETEFRAGNVDTALETAAAALDTNAGLPRQVPAALLYLAAGRTEEAATIAQELRASLQSQSRAYGSMLQGLVELQAGKTVEAIDLISAGAQQADLWLVRFSLGRAYLEAGYYAEALDEFTSCDERRGEATSIFLDDLPTYRYMAELPYWLGRAQEQLGMQDAARANFTVFLERRGDAEPLAQDARERLDAGST